jgi:pimeloyl-ACP methyl ester carboxylesterase
MASDISRVRTPNLEIAYEESGPADGVPVVLLHGFPYDPRAFDEVAPALAREGLRTIVPYLRGYGATKFLSPLAMRSGQQGAVGQDLIELVDALGLEKPLLAGFDWGARAACIVAALWPDRVRGLVTCGGYQVQDLSRAQTPVDPEQERRFWYWYYFSTERGRAGLLEMPDEICRLLWKLWSPTWAFDDATFLRTAQSFRNPDFVDVVLHSYRHRIGAAEGDPRHAALEARLAALPQIRVPTIALHGSADGVNPPETSLGHEKYFASRYERRVLEDIGHDVPQEAPHAFSKAVMDLMQPSRTPRA